MKTAALIVAVVAIASVAIVRAAMSEPPVIKPIVRRHLPSECAQFYNDDTDQWVECMGVGKR